MRNALQTARSVAYRVSVVALIATLVVGMAACDAGGYYEPAPVVVVHQHTTVHQHIIVRPRPTPVRPAPRRR